MKQLIVSLLYWAFCFYFFMPTVRFGFEGLPFLVGIWAVLMVSAGQPDMISKKARRVAKPISLPKSSMVWVGILAISIIYFVFAPMITSWSAFHADKYHQLIGEVRIGESFSKDVAPIPLEKIRIVDQDLAARLGDKILGSQPSLGSQAHLGEFHIQKVKGEFLWIAPLLHSGFFKWYSNSQGTPGYVAVSATNERDVRLVQQLPNGTPLFVKYQDEAYGFSNLERHIYTNGYLTRGYTDFTFEINDDGQPFWVVTLFEKKIGFEGNDATGVLLVNVTTGEMKEYSIADAPAWVDRIQPEYFIVDQLDNWGEYVHGWWNPSNEGKLTTTPGMSLIYDEGGHSFWYTGLTSVGADDGTVGFVLVNTRTKETVWYKQTGATEQAAMVSAMGKVQEKGYSSSFPITYNVNGVPTYVVSLKDQAGLIKMVGMVSVQDYSIVAVGDDLASCARSYKNSLNSTGNSIAPQSTSTRYEIRSVVERIAPDVQNGRTLYYLTLRGYRNKIFVGSSSISPELALTAQADSVSLFYDEGQLEYVDVVGFDNLQIVAEKTESKQPIQQK